MTHFKIEMNVTCPSNWTETEVKKWVGKILDPYELATVQVTQTDKLVLSTSVA